MDNDDLVGTLETIVEKFDQEMAPYAAGLCQHLVAAFWRILAADDKVPRAQGTCRRGFKYFRLLILRVLGL